MLYSYSHTLAQLQRPLVLMEGALTMSKKALLNLGHKSHHFAYLSKLDQKKIKEINFNSLLRTAKDSIKFFPWESRSSRRMRTQAL